MLQTVSIAEVYLLLQAYQQLAEGLASSKQIHSKLICPVTRRLMNEHNPPVVLPNGSMFSEKAVQDLANKAGDFTRPSSGARVCRHLLSVLAQIPRCMSHETDMAVLCRPSL